GSTSAPRAPRPRGARGPPRPRRGPGRPRRAGTARRPERISTAAAFAEISTTMHGLVTPAGQDAPDLCKSALALAERDAERIAARYS
ncbi:hypothetical protein ABZ297_46840, partial [Nonomuraea sp. NPDC005983]|uniref:hypothetical protein n=1 Tax=Nonomuraea sp. NPDC005983 TaxID=3155595 RepID=UPI0033A920BF